MSKGTCHRQSSEGYWKEEYNRLLKLGYNEDEAFRKIEYRKVEFGINLGKHGVPLRRGLNCLRIS